MSRRPGQAVLRWINGTLYLQRDGIGVPLGDVRRDDEGVWWWRAQGSLLGESGGRAAHEQDARRRLISALRRHAAALSGACRRTGVVLT